MGEVEEKERKQYYGALLSRLPTTGGNWCSLLGDSRRDLREPVTGTHTPSSSWKAGVFLSQTLFCH